MMPKQQTNIDSAPSTKAWLKRLAEEYVKLDAAMPVKNLLPEDEGPAWVQNVEREVAAMMFPEAKLKKQPGLTPKRMGALIGHQCASGVWLMEQLNVAAANPNTNKFSLSPRQIREGKKMARVLTEDWFEGLRNLAKLALSSCVDQSYEDMREFLLAYAAAFARKPQTVGDFGHSAFRIYVFMLMNWRLVAQLHSIREFHEVLDKVFGFDETGDLKRIEKICQRIGLRFRKPGRPKRSK